MIRSLLPKSSIRLIYLARKVGLGLPRLTRVLVMVMRVLAVAKDHEFLGFTKITHQSSWT